MSIRVPRGFRVAGVPCGIKTVPGREDLALLASDRAATAAGVYTTNLVHAACVTHNRARTPSGGMRVIAVNSGNANACTGARGLRDCEEMANLAARAVGALPGQALVLSTGIIGHFLPMDRIARGLEDAAARLANDDESLAAAARGIMTTDTRPKLAGRPVPLSGGEVQITGMAKGAGMIAPNMATMLAVLLTDAALPPSAAQALLAEAAGATFNCISVDGHMSTNDSVLLLANGASGTEPLAGAEREPFRAALREVCEELATAVVADGEGATHLVTIDVRGCASREAALRIARSIADSPLVKTAVAGCDPNWGRIVSAAGYAGVPFDPARVNLRLNGALLYDCGAPADFDAEAVSQSMRSSRDTHVELTLGEGQASARFWTTDLTAEYVRINADYHT